jgi:hypothetical protein
MNGIEGIYKKWKNKKKKIIETKLKSMFNNINANYNYKNNNDTIFSTTGKITTFNNKGNMGSMSRSGFN